MFVTSENPNVTFTNINSVVIPNTDLSTTRVVKNKWSIGIQAGYGATLQGLSPYVGIGGQYNIFS